MNPAWVVPIGSGILSMSFVIAEQIRPARHVDYANLILADGLAALSYQLMVVPIAGRGSGPFGTIVSRFVILPDAIAHLPLGLRFILYYLLADFGSYWMHRAMHTRHVWRVHEWHHAPTNLWWLAGVRASVPQQILFNLPGILAVPLIAGAPGWILPVLVLEGIFRNNWMHMNVTWKSEWIERIFVTPRFHHIHHSAEPQHFDRNFGSLFSIWDRLFGTQCLPDTTTPRRFGAPTTKNPIRLFLGL